MGLTYSALNFGKIPFFTYTSKGGFFFYFADEEHQSITFFP